MTKWYSYLDDSTTQGAEVLAAAIENNVGIVRWPTGTFMKPHFDSNNVHTPNKVAAMLYLNNDFEGGNLIFEDRVVKPEPGKLIIFENTKNLHYVDKVEDSERYALSFWYYSVE